MVSNQTGVNVGWFAGAYPGRIGHLYSPGGQRGPWEFLPYALDNGAFSSSGSWSVEEWRKLIAWAKLQEQKPMWVLVPDSVGDREWTLRMWDQYKEESLSVGSPLAFAVQDGMSPKDVPLDASVVFVGGSTEWKWRTLPMWCGSFSRVHVGRVNGIRKLLHCESLGAESIDGTGWFHRSDTQFGGLRLWVSGHQFHKQHELGFIEETQ